MLIQQSEAAEQAYQEALAVLQELAASGLPEVPSGRETVPAPALPPRTTDLPSWSEHSFRELVEGLPDAVVVINDSARIVLVNHQTELLFGWSRDELLGHVIEVLVPERLREVHVKHRRGYLETKEPPTRPLGGVHMELFGRRKDGSEFPVEISLSPMRGPAGLLVTSVIRDITERKRHAAKFRTLLENIPAVTFIAPMDESSPELYVSPQIEQLLGFSQKEWLEDPVLWHRQLHPEDRERWNLHFAPTCANGTPFRAAYRFIAKDGREVWVHGSANMVRDDEGKVLFLQGVAFDITPIKEAEQAVHRAQEDLRRANAELERRVEERTEELARSMAGLREKSEELNKYAYHVTHDFKEPLRTVLTHAQRLARQFGTQLPPEAAERTKKIIDGAASMQSLLEKLHEYADVAKERRPEMVDCNAAVERACASLQVVLDESEAHVEVVAELPTIVGMKEHLELLFQNLIGNAIKYRSPDRPPRIEIGAERQAEGWLFWVRDNGMGIEPKYWQRIFGMGEQLNSRSRYGGWGYGLAICEKTVLRHGGRIWVASEVGQGSTFFFTLPETPPERRAASEMAG